MAFLEYLANFSWSFSVCWNSVGINLFYQTVITIFFGGLKTWVGRVTGNKNYFLGGLGRPGGIISYFLTYKYLVTNTGYQDRVLTSTS